MKNIVILLVAFLTLTSCVDHKKLLDQREGKAYVVDRSGYGPYTVMREYNYGEYYTIRYGRDEQLIPGDRILIKDIRDCIGRSCKAKLNQNYQSYITVEVLLRSHDQFETYHKFEQITGVAYD